MTPLSREAFADAVQQLYDLNDQASVDTILSSYAAVCDQLAAMEVEIQQLAAHSIAKMDEYRLDLTASQSRCTQVEEAMKLYKDASYQSHNGHWDTTGGGGSGCPQCIRAHELRDKAELVLASTERPQP